MDESKHKNLLPILMVITIIFGGYMISEKILKSSRPNVPTQGPQYYADESFNARLWQDPLQAAADYLESMSKEDKAEYLEKAKNSKIPAKLKKRIQEKNSHIIFVMIRAGTFAEDHERRLRNRYTVITALHDSKFIPENPDQLSSFPFRFNDNVTDDKDSSDPNKFSAAIPYEWFIPDSITLNNLKSNKTEQVLVFWLPEREFLKSPLAKLAAFVKDLGYNPKKQVLTLIGPSHSGTLHAMLEEIPQTKKLQTKPTSNTSKFWTGNCILDIPPFVSETTRLKLECKTEINIISSDSDSSLSQPKEQTDLSSLEGLRIFSPWSTVVPHFLIHPTSEMTGENLKSMDALITNTFKRQHIAFVRMIRTDDLLSAYLLKELKLRDIDPINRKDRIVLISEWDTLYGRAFTYTFASVLQNEGATCQCPAFASWLTEAANQKNFPSNLGVYYYIRGIDGKTPKFTSEEISSGMENTSTNLMTFIRSKCPEPPTGRSQLDYVRRLVIQMNLKYIINKEIRPKAIGIISSDVYDKLLLIQALREEFRDIPIFTVDLDARLMHRNSFTWTHNVIVASNYGLSLDSDRYSKKQNTLQFRDNYQTSLYRTCLEAINNTSCKLDDIQHNLPKPKLFEVGRDRPIELKIKDHELVQMTETESKKDMAETKLKKDMEIRDAIISGQAFQATHDFFRNIMNAWQPILLSTIGLFSLLCLTPNSRRCLYAIFLRRRKHTSIQETEPYKDYHNELRIWFVVTIIVMLVLMAIINIDHIRCNGEPFSLVAGTSIWPGSILRFIAIVFGFFFILKSLKCLEENKKEMNEKFFTRPIILEDPNHDDTGHFKQFWKKDINFFRWKHDSQKTAQAECIWAQYTRWGDFRLYQTVLFTIIAAIIIFVLIKMMEYPSNPFRGGLSKITNAVITFLCGVIVLFLISFVFDATCLCTRFIRNLNTPNTDWPDEILNRKNESMNMVHEDLIPLINIKCIALRTEIVGTLVYYPSIILFIIIVSRSQFFDNWEFPMRLIVAFLVMFAIILSCAVSMRKSAERARSAAIKKLQENLCLAQSGQKFNKGRIEQIKLVIEQIKAIRKGAFSPLTENPVIHAILIPSGGTSALMLLRLFMN